MAHDGPRELLEFLVGTDELSDAPSTARVSRCWPPNDKNQNSETDFSRNDSMFRAHNSSPDVKRTRCGLDARRKLAFRVYGPNMITSDSINIFASSVMVALRNTRKGDFSTLKITKCHFGIIFLFPKTTIPPSVPSQQYDRRGYKRVWNRVKSCNYNTTGLYITFSFPVILFSFFTVLPRPFRGFHKLLLGRNGRGRGLCVRGVMFRDRETPFVFTPHPPPTPIAATPRGAYASNVAAEIWRI